MFDKLYEKLSKINDNRVKGRVKYPLVLILMILFIGVLKGGNGWKEIRMLAQVSILELKKFYPTLANDNFPAVDTIARAVKKVDPAEYSALLAT
jgi:hypothetical protein